MGWKINKKFLSATFTLSGTVIGAGILGLPYVFSKAGFWTGIFWLILLGAIVLFGFLYLGEVSLRTRGNHQLPGLARKYLGNWGGRIMTLAVMIGIYSSLLAYLIAEGESFSRLFFGTGEYSFYFAIGFWMIFSFLLTEGLKQLGKIETCGVLAIIIIILAILIIYLPQVQLSNLTSVNPSNFFLPFGVVLFALLGFTSIPELRLEIKGQERNLKKAIIIGFLIPIILYAIFTFVSVGFLDNNVSEIATLSFGPIVIILGIFTMLTSYLVLSFSLKDLYIFDMGLSRLKAFFWTTIPPLIIFLIVNFFGVGSFVGVMGIGGVFSGGTVVILSVLMNYRAKKIGSRKPEYSVPINWLVILLFVVIFVAGMIAQVVLN